ATAASIALGAFLGVIGNKLIVVRENNRWKWAYYVFGILVTLFGAVEIIREWNAIKEGRLLSIGIIVFALVAGILVLFSTRKLLDVKNVYSIPELDPVINKFTRLGDRNEIKLFGGDLNFFGNSSAEIDSNKQYSELRARQFAKVLILCEARKSADTRLRYGKLLTDIANVELRFYRPDKADLRVRGRLIKVNGLDKLLMYTKVKPGYYQAIETDTADSNGALYNNIWELVWSMAEAPTQDQCAQFIKLYKGGA
ncbi:MAG TPA: hypothetical protein PK951_14290, partial [Chitinophagaceae bacterium]|nr:hypothetical protein [Chitinophagaceae bacterium]